MNKSILKRVLLLAAAAVVIFVVYWFALPPLNLQSREFWRFLLTAIIIVCVALFLSFGRSPNIKESENFKQFLYLKSPRMTAIKIVACSVACYFLLGIVAFLIGCPLFNAKAYYGLINVETGNFAEEVAELDMSAIPVVDRDTASRLGKRKLGEMSDLVSQFEITENYTQINYKETPYRVTTLSYGDFFKWLNNQAEGVPAYITVDMVTQEASLVRLENGIRYSEGEYFLRNINRHLRFNFPTKIFGDLSFEIDESGTPYWIAPCITYRIGLWDGRDISGAVLVNAVTGECGYYDLGDIPEWVDQVFISDIIIEQLNYYGVYVNGFWNSLFGQKNVLNTTTGYNYIAKDGDVWLYTGMTSVATDESNVGFVLVNLRTKETRFYAVPGAEEYSAMSSAQGQVQHLNYRSTFPILLNIADRPTYFVSLKDGAGLVKMYAFVDVERYQIVGVGATVAEAMKDYAAKLKGEDISVGDGQTISGDFNTDVKDVRFVVIDGTTNVVITTDQFNQILYIPVTLHEKLPFVQVGDWIAFEYTMPLTDNPNEPMTVTRIIDIELKSARP